MRCASGVRGGQRHRLVIADDEQEHDAQHQPGDADRTETRLPAPTLRDEASNHDAEHRSDHAGRQEGAEHRAAHPRRKQAREQGGAHGAVRRLAHADQGTRADQMSVAGGERARDRRETPDQCHQEHALDAAPPVGEQRQRNRTHRDGDRDDRDERAQLAVRKVPLRLQVREHRHHHLAVDIVDDHQREQDCEYGPRVTAWCRTVVRRVEGNVSRREGHVSLSPGAEPALGPRNSSRSDAALDGVNFARIPHFRT